MRTKIAKRLKVPSDEIDQIMFILDSYGIEPTIRNFDGQGFVLRDLNGKTVRICDGQYRSQMIHIQKPYTDIVIIYADGMLVGWMFVEDLIDVDDRMLADTKLVNSMPTVFKFVRECPHMEIYGGFCEDGYWECFGCGQKLVYCES